MSSGANRKLMVVQPTRNRMVVSSSGLGHLLACGYPYRSDVIPPPDTGSNKAAITGTAFHTAAELLAFGDTYSEAQAIEVALRENPEADADAVCAYVAYWQPVWEKIVGRYPGTYDESTGTGWLVEQPYAFNTADRTVRVIKRPTKEDHSYESDPDTEIPGTFDIVRVNEDSVVVGDLKTGKGLKTVQEHIHQIVFGAICAARMHAKKRASVFIAHVTPEAKPGMRIDVPDHVKQEFFDGVLITSMDISEEQLIDSEDKICNAFQNIWRASPVIGPQCDYCRVKPVCPTSRETVALLAPGTALLRQGYNSGLVPTIQTDEQAAAVYELKGRIAALNSMAEDMLKSYVAQKGPVELPSGKVLGFWPRTQEYVVTDIAAPILEEELGPLASVAIDKRVTKASIARATANMAKAESDAKLNSIRERLLEAGALRKKEMQVFDKRAKSSLPQTKP